MRSSRGGFSLLELILVMLLIVTVGAIVIPRLADSFPALQVDRSARTLLAWARQARASAALRGARHRLVLDVEKGRFWIEVQADPLRDPGRFERATGVWNGENLPDGVTLGEFKGFPEKDGRRVLEFQPDGTTEDASVAVANARGDRQVVRIAGATGDVAIGEEP